MKFRFMTFGLVAVLFFSTSAFARNTEHLFSVEDAVTSSIGKKALKDVPYYFIGQKHPKVKKEIGEWKSNKKTRGAFRSDEKSCQVAFLSALVSLQQRVTKEDGDAIINIRSVTKNKITESATEFRCVAGAIIVHVALEGTVVKLVK